MTSSPRKKNRTAVRRQMVRPTGRAVPDPRGTAPNAVPPTAQHASKPRGQRVRPLEKVSRYAGLLYAATVAAACAAVVTLSIAGHPGP